MIAWALDFATVVVSLAVVAAVAGARVLQVRARRSATTSAEVSANPDGPKNKP